MTCKIKFYSNSKILIATAINENFVENTNMLAIILYTVYWIVTRNNYYIT